ncbi:DUF2812 domain-containing protein [Paenibacillus radicis (ex Gao et al. 2016)]|uniref:DUF2812 domain-containing protein n=1 Tax=Paenibacillus radicis (ex Gao et al. 2016) TaxID=1737354 RepID=A0A917HES8_9BACL|nr:DUF2812 domain-containing protein [Paenibacillus radicis (ex Gao et al. 2016)]GGG76237.1 hypothetical protein GCM10010918_35930 [Paenibacillus radicis (ex Gao et al. 2016)]
MREQKSEFKWWSNWAPEKLERWMEQKEATGWHLVRVSGNAIRFHYQKGEPRKMRYCVDYQNKVDGGYVSLFEEAGWTLVYKATGWYIWGMAYEGDQRPEIYTDSDSLIERNKRLSTTLLIVLFMQFPILLVNFGILSKFPLIWIVYLVLFSFLTYGIIRLNAANHRFKNKGGRFDGRN